MLDETTHDETIDRLAQLEAILMSADTAVSTERLASVVELSDVETRGLLTSLGAEYRGELKGARPRGFELRETDAGWRIFSARSQSETVAKFMLDGQSSRLSQAALETLAVIAYKQPVTRGQVAAIRGVNVDGVVRTLILRNLITEVGQDPSTNAVLFGTTDEFLNRMGWRSLDAMPPLAPHLPGVDDIDGYAS